MVFQLNWSGSAVTQRWAATRLTYRAYVVGQPPNSSTSSPSPPADHLHGTCLRTTTIVSTHHGVHYHPHRFLPLHHLGHLRSPVRQHPAPPDSIDRLVSVFGLHSAFLELTHMAIGFETLAYVLSSIRPLAGDDLHSNIHRTATQLDLLLVVLFLVTSGSMCYLQ
ncbi:hypothetical protein C8T65DRAFT_833314 [Cerioporus squamosus]|nr:hypothetical protein C8T65DRAFT_833314 [Cerioporus squamosus]